MTNEQFEFLSTQMKNYVNTLDDIEKGEQYGTEREHAKEVLNDFMSELLNDYHGETIDLGMKVQDRKLEIVEIHQEQSKLRDEYLIPE